MKMKRVLLLSIILICLTGCGANDRATVTGKAVITGCDFGPVLSKAVIEIPEAIESNNLSKEMIEVRDIRKTGFFADKQDREVTDVYYSDESGNRVDDAAADFMTVELYYSPEAGSPFYYDEDDGFTKWVPQYSLEISVNGEKAVLPVTTNGGPVEDNVLLPEIADADMSGTFTGGDGNRLTYASYAPDNASEDNKRPLVIWLHGGGEGGTDPRITMYGTKVVALLQDEFQSTMDGAYVLVPQTAEYWKRNESGEYFSNETGGDHSMYLNDLQELIDDFIAANHVDSDRIIVGGASNGGFMALDMLIHDPERYAGAYLICEIYEPELISDDEVAAIKDIPMWFVYAENDMTVVPSMYEEPLIKRLKDAGCKDVHASVFEDVHDTSGEFTSDGEPYQYLGHFSWYYFFNNECADGDMSLWNWMAGLTKRTR